MSDQITIQDGIKDELNKFALENGVSTQGLMSAMALIVMGKTRELGECHVNWKLLKKRYPPREYWNDKRWSRVVKGVRTILDDMGIEDLSSLDPRDVESIAARSKYTYAQVKAALLSIIEEDY